MKKILAIVLMMAMMAVLACSAFASGDPSAAPAAPAAEEPAAAEGTFQIVFKEATAAENGWIFEIDAASGNVVNVIYVAPLGGGAAAADDLAAWKAYLIAYAVAGAPNEEEGQTVAGLIDAAATEEEVMAIPQLTVLFENVGVLTYDAWIAAGMPAADTEGMGSEADNQASGEATEEAASEEPAASGEPAASEEPASSEEPAATEEAPAAEEAAALANPNYDPSAHNWASIEIVMTIIIIVVGAVLMLSFGKKKID